MTLENLINGEFHKGLHDDIVKSVVKRLQASGLYDEIKYCANYYFKKSNRYGEADILARANDRYFAFEIKSSDRGRVKAYLQLMKDNLLLRREGCQRRPYLFHVYKDKDNNIIYKRIRHRG